MRIHTLARIHEEATRLGLNGKRNKNDNKNKNEKKTNELNKNTRTNLNISEGRGFEGITKRKQITNKF